MIIDICIFVIALVLGFVLGVIITSKVIKENCKETGLCARDMLVDQAKGHGGMSG